MELELDPDKTDYFEQHLGDFGPWMHTYKLGDKIVTGYYKYQGIDGNLTFVNSRSPESDVERLRGAYARCRHDVWADFVESLFERLEPARPARAGMRVLDIASATGQLSIRAAAAGFGRVMSSEIREGQVAQERLLLDCLRDASFRDRIVPVHDPVSADAPEYPDRYLSEPPDVVLSFGLLYHLMNPLQHLLNLHAIAKRYVVIYTMTHYHPLAKNLWSMTVENAAWITKATSSISWTPHFLEVQRLCRQIGFRKVEMFYPAIFQRNFPEMTGGYSRWTDAKVAAQMALHRTTGIRMGHLKNHDFAYFRDAGVNPNYVAYVCEK